MSHNTRVWQVNKSDYLDEINETNLDLEKRLQKWLINDIAILDDDLLVIGKEVPTECGDSEGYIDLLCIDSRGDLVVVELKRGKTPRHTVSQALDYASWVDTLSYERIVEIAAILFPHQSLEDIFQSKFGDKLPENLNTKHRIVLVASEVDKTSERIINYLSNNYGMNINAVTFQYFHKSEDLELLTRVFLLEPEEVINREMAKGGGKRSPNLTDAEIESIVTKNNVADIYQQAMDLIKPMFTAYRTNRSSINFVIRSQGKESTIINLLVKESSESDGLKFQIIAKRAKEHFRLSEDELIASLPQGFEPWQRDQNSDENWNGYQAFFTSVNQLELFVQKIQSKRIDED